MGQSGLKENVVALIKTSLAANFHMSPCVTISAEHFEIIMETWMNGSCVECACVNDSITCKKTVVNITYGLYKVSVFACKGGK